MLVPDVVEEVLRFVRVDSTKVRLGATGSRWRLGLGLMLAAVYRTTLKPTGSTKDDRPSPALVRLVLTVPYVTSRLVEMDLQEVTEPELARVARHGIRLVQLRLSSREDQLPVHHMDTIALHMDSLKRLDLRGYRHLGDEHAKCIARIPTLTALHLLEARKLTAGGLTTMVAGLPALRELALPLCPSVDSESMAALPQAAPALTSLDVSLCPNITGVAIAHIGRGLRGLRALKLCGCVCIDEEEEGLRQIATLPQLEKLTCSSVAGPPLSDSHLRRHVAVIGTLRSLDLSDNTELSDNGIEALSTIRGSLEELRLSGCTGVTGASLRHLATFKRLASLDLQGCDVDDDIMDTLRPLQSTLRILNVVFCCTDDGVEKLCSALPQLEELYLGGVTDDGLQWLGQPTPMRFLRSLCLCFCSVTNAGLQALQQDSLPVLRSVRLIQCPRVTDDGITALVNRGVAVS